LARCGGAVLTLKELAAGGISGVAAHVTGYAVSGRLFHHYQSDTPAKWRTRYGHSNDRRCALPTPPSGG